MKVFVKRVNKAKVHISDVWVRTNGEKNLTNFGKIIVTPSVILHKKDSLLEVSSTGLIYRVKVFESLVANYEFYVVGIRNRSLLRFCFLISRHYINAGTLKYVVQDFISDPVIEKVTYKAIVDKYIHSSDWQLYVASKRAGIDQLSEVSP